MVARKTKRPTKPRGKLPRGFSWVYVGGYERAGKTISGYWRQQATSAKYRKRKRQERSALPKKRRETWREYIRAILQASCKRLNNPQCRVRTSDSPMGEVGEMRFPLDAGDAAHAVSELEYQAIWSAVKGRSLWVSGAFIAYRIRFTKSPTFRHDSEARLATHYYRLENFPAMFSTMRHIANNLDEHGDIRVRGLILRIVKSRKQPKRGRQ